MLYKRPFSTFFVLLLLGTFPTVQPTRAEIPRAFRVAGVPRIKQLHNYCGPAALASVMQNLGCKLTQETIGREIYDSSSGGSNGGDMLLFARERGYAAYSWNSSIADVKLKLAAGFPVIALQQNSTTDTSGHYRVVAGYDEDAAKFFIVDPYYDNITELTYSDCERLWRPMGYWALVVLPADKDTFVDELGERNPVVHMDLSYARYKRKDYEDALKEAQIALKIEPRNSFARSILGQIQRAMGAGTQ